MSRLSDDFLNNYVKYMKFSKASLYSLAVFIITFIVYLLTVAPGISFTDSGELAGVCATLGVAHPTGYPLFTILGHLWTLLPIPADNVHSLNIFAAFLTAVSAGVFFLLALRFFKAVFKENKSDNIFEISAFVMSLIYAFGQTVWLQAVALEVYSLQLLIINLTLLSFIKAFDNKGKQGKYFFLTAFMLGLGFANHMTTMLMIPAILYIFFKRPGEKFSIDKNRLKSFLFLLIPLLLGASLYLFLVFRSSSHPEFNWGWVSRSFDKFFYHVSGKQFQVWMFTGEKLGENFLKFFELIPYQLGIIGIIPLLYGIGALYKRSKEYFAFALLLLLICIAYAVNYSIHDIDSYFITAIVSLALITGIGIVAMIKKYMNGKNSSLAYSFVLIPFVSVFINYNECDRSDDYLVEEYTRIMTENLDENAIIISSQWDYWCSAFWYKQIVDGYRPDIVLVEKELLRRTWYLEQFKLWYPEVAKKVANEMNAFQEELEKFESGKNYSPAIQTKFLNMIEAIIRTNIGQRPVYLTHDIWQDEADRSIGQKYVQVPQGFATRLEKDKKAWPVSMDKMNLDTFIASIGGREEHLVKGIQQVVVYNLADRLGAYAIKTKNFNVALQAFKTAAKMAPDNKNIKRVIMQLRSALSKNQ